ncbi:MAG: LTA synthase family protein [Clostridia bacterium]|nr:LTA synthase family protein [Clostridia bacterium]
MKKSAVPFSNTVYIFILTLFLTLKSRLVYSGLRLAEFEPPLALATGGIFLTLYALLVCLFPIKARPIMTVIYWLASFAMGIDGVYFAYVSKLPSAALLGMVGQLDDISDTIQSLIQLKHLAMIADLPFVFLFSLHTDLLFAKLSRTKLAQAAKQFAGARFSRRKTLLVILPVSAAAFLFTFLFPAFEPAYMLNELFCYHTTDAVRTIWSSAGERNVDKSLYTEPDWSDSDVWGIAEGRNVIIIQVEALQNFVLGRSYEGQEIMPNLNALIAQDSFYFDRYYYQIGGGNTADAEFAVNNSLFAPDQEAAYVKYPDNTYHGLPYLLKDHGYSGAHAFHAYIPSFWNREAAYPGQGFDSFTSLEDLEQTDMFPMGLSDMEMFRQTMEELKTYEEPFYAFYVTLSSHYPYGIPLKDRDITLIPEDEQTLFGLYLHAINYADRAIGSFISMLKEAGLYDNSVLVIYGDHYALANTDPKNMERVSKLLGRTYSSYDVFNVPLIIHIPGMNRTETCSIAGGHMDVLPTLLPLLGIHNDKAVMFGQNLLEADSGLVCQQTHMAIGSFISDTLYYKKPHNNIKSNYDAYEWGTMNRLDPYLFRDLSDLCTERIADCAFLLANDDILLD